MNKAHDHSKYENWVDPNAVVPYERNVKIHTDKQIEDICTSIRRFGWQQDTVITTDNVLVIGHGRRLAAMRLGCQMPYHIIDKTADQLTDEDIRELRIADNQTNAETGFDFAMLEEELADLSFDGFNFDFNISGNEQGGAQPEIIEDNPPEVQEKVISKPGQIYQLGSHRLICGDSTDVNVIDRLMDGEKADIAFSSPPYNAGTTATETATGKTTKYNGNDDNKSESEYRDFLNAYIHCAMGVSKYVFMNVQSISNNKISLIDVLADNKDIYADTIIWDKQNGQPAMAHNVLNSVFEYIHIFSEKANRAIGTIDFRGTIDNILHLPPQRHNEYADVHNATFSVEFASWFISRFAKESVFDSFGGTGTTLIACEQLGRRCFMCELDPHYVDVIIQRWETFTGEKAVLLNV